MRLPSIMTYTVAPHLQYFAVPLASFIAARPEMEGFGVGAYIFSRADHPSRILLLQRAESDSMPGCWEGPGGACEPDKDETLLDSLVRETFEESGLHVSRVVELVAVNCWEHHRRTGGKIRLVKYSFIVDVHESLHSDTKEPVPAAQIPVQLEATEHQHYDWATEDNVHISLKSTSGPYKFPYLSMGHQAPNILRAFELLKD